MNTFTKDMPHSFNVSHALVFFLLYELGKQIDSIMPDDFSLGLLDTSGVLFFGEKKGPSSKEEKILVRSTMWTGPTSVSFLVDKEADNGRGAITGGQVNASIGGRKMIYPFSVYVSGSKFVFQPAGEIGTLNFFLEKDLVGYSFES